MDMFLFVDANIVFYHDFNSIFYFIGFWDDSKINNALNLDYFD